MIFIYIYLCIYINTQNHRKPTSSLRIYGNLSLRKQANQTCAWGPEKWFTTQTLPLLHSSPHRPSLILSSLMPQSPSVTNIGMFHLPLHPACRFSKIPPSDFMSTLRTFYLKSPFMSYCFIIWFLLHYVLAASGLSHIWSKNINTLFLSVSLSDKHFVYHKLKKIHNQFFLILH